MGASDQRGAALGLAGEINVDPPVPPRARDQRRRDQRGAWRWDGNPRSGRGGHPPGDHPPTPSVVSPKGVQIAWKIRSELVAVPPAAEEGILEVLGSPDHERQLGEGPPPAPAPPLIAFGTAAGSILYRNHPVPALLTVARLGR